LPWFKKAAALSLAVDRLSDPVVLFDQLNKQLPVEMAQWALSLAA
jgi:hypothetical protein